MSYMSLVILMTDDLFCKTNYKQISDAIRVFWSFFCKAYSFYYLKIVYDGKFNEDERFSAIKANMNWMM